MNHFGPCIGFVCTCSLYPIEVFKKGNRIRHINCLDMDLIIATNPYENSAGDLELVVSYWNNKYEAYMVAGLDVVWVKKDDRSKWRVIE